MSELGPFISAQELASQLHLSMMTAYKHLNDGTIPAMRLGKKWLIRADVIQEMMKR